MPAPTFGRTTFRASRLLDPNWVSWRPWRLESGGGLLCRGQQVHRPLPGSARSWRWAQIDRNRSRL